VNLPPMLTDTNAFKFPEPSSVRRFSTVTWILDRGVVLVFGVVIILFLGLLQTVRRSGPLSFNVLS